jgi:hypothetical protein
METMTRRLEDDSLATARGHTLEAYMSSILRSRGTLHSRGRVGSPLPSQTSCARQASESPCRDELEVLAPSRDGLCDCKDCGGTTDSGLWHWRFQIIVVAQRKQKFLDLLTLARTLNVVELGREKRQGAKRAA